MAISLALSLQFAVMLLFYYPVKWLYKQNKIKLSFKMYTGVTLLFFIVAALFGLIRSLVS